MSALWVFLGGGAGSLLRYGCNVLMGFHLGSGFPWATLTVNALGSFLLAGLMAWPSDAIRPEVRLALGTGMMGGFTTYSTFNLETLRMLDRGAWAMAGLYLGATVALCLLGGAGGLALARAWR
ncbi:MAG: CrcB family protein [Myxococcota bacterium]